MKPYDSIVCFSSIPWNFSFHRQQDMMCHFAAKGMRVLYVEPPITRTAALLRSWSTEPARQNVTVLRYGGLRFERCLHSAERINRMLCRKAVTGAMKQLNLTRPLIWFDRIHGVDCDWFMARYPSAYDLVDEITAFGRWNNKRMLEKKERDVMKWTGFRITSSRTLAARKQHYCAEKNIFFCPNGVDCSRFGDRGQGPPEKPHPLLEGVGSPIIGFVGTISRRGINKGLLMAAAAESPDLQFVLIGPTDDRALIDELRRRPNIRCFDRVDSNEIPELIRGFDVGIIPYNTATPDMDYVFPRKAFEYLASGVPVVATPLPELAPMASLIHIAADAKEFSQAIRAALKQAGDPDETHRLRDAAQQFDWNVLLNGLESFLQIG